MIRLIHLILILFYIVAVRAQEFQKNSTAAYNDFNLQNKNYPVTSWNQIIGTSTINIDASPSGESLLNNLLCDAMRKRTNTDFSFLNLGEFNATLYAGDITHLDLFRLCPYDRTLVVIETNGEVLYRLIESQICGSRHGLAISGGIVEYDTARPNHNRLTFFQIGEHPVYPKKDYRVVTTDYIVKGIAGFEILSEIDSLKVFHTGILLRDAVADYIQSYSPLNESVVTADNRWKKR